MFTQVFVLFAVFYAVFGQPKCPNGWYKFENKCYYVANKQNTLYHNLKLCSDLNATLVSLHSEKEVYFLLSVLPKANEWFHWIGLMRIQVGVRQFTWSDGSPVDYLNWHPDNPKNPGPLDNIAPWGAVIYSDGLFHDTEAHTSRGEICQIVLPFEEKSSGQTNADRFAYLEKKVDKLETLYKNLEDLQKDTHGQVNEIGSQILAKLFEIPTDGT